MRKIIKPPFSNPSRRVGRDLRLHRRQDPVGPTNVDGLQQFAQPFTRRTLIIVDESNPIAGCKLDGAIACHGNVGFRLHVIVDREWRAGSPVLFNNGSRAAGRIVVHHHQLIRKPILPRYILEDDAQALVAAKRGHTDADPGGFGAIHHRPRSSA